MTIPHDLTADLPPPRDDEPASLRQDIVDELADHLQSALHRELLAGRSSEPCETASDSHDSSIRTAQHRALTRFGNPAAIARQLWFDAMKERLMVQKLTLLLATVTTAAVVFLSVVLWQTLDRAGEAQRLANEAQLALAQRSEQLSTSILQALESLRTAPAQASAVDGWAPLTIKLVSEAGDPVQGTVSVRGTPIGGDKADVESTRTIGPDGIAECGLLPYGNYTMTITATAAEETHTEQFMVAPGQPNERTVVCPTSPPLDVKARFAIETPKSLRTSKLRFIVNLKAGPRHIGGEEWVSAENENLELWVDASGQILDRIGHSIPGTDFNGVVPNLVGLDFQIAPPLREYMYELRSIMICVANIEVPDNVGAAFLDQWVFRARHGLEPQYPSTYFVPPAGRENVLPVEIPAAIWADVIDDFRMSPEARHITIPNGWETVTIPESKSNGGMPVSVNDFVDVTVLGVSDDGILQFSTLIDSVPFVAIDSVRSQTLPVDESGYVLLVTTEQGAGIEKLKTLDRILFVFSAAENEAETPVLHEDVLEEIMQAVAPDDS